MKIKLKYIQELYNAFDAFDGNAKVVNANGGESIVRTPFPVDGKTRWGIAKARAALKPLIERLAETRNMAIRTISGGNAIRPPADMSDVKALSEYRQQIHTLEEEMRKMVEIEEEIEIRPIEFSQIPEGFPTAALEVLIRHSLVTEPKDA